MKCVRNHYWKFCMVFLSKPYIWKWCRFIHTINFSALMQIFHFIGLLYFRLNSHFWTARINKLTNWLFWLLNKYTTFNLIFTNHTIGNRWKLLYEGFFISRRSNNIIWNLYYNSLLYFWIKFLFLYWINLDFKWQHVCCSFMLSRD